jgi:hypothetical protein
MSVEQDERLLNLTQFLYEPHELEELFTALVEEWRRDTAMLSFVDKKVTHPAYQRIIGLGKQAVPLILRELQERPSYWFWALKCMTGADPVRPGYTFDQATNAWLDWGRGQGYIV